MNHKVIKNSMFNIFSQAAVAYDLSINVDFSYHGFTKKNENHQIKSSRKFDLQLNS